MKLSIAIVHKSNWPWLTILQHLYSKKNKNEIRNKEITTRLPSGKLVVYLRVQKSRATANVVGA